MTPDTRTYTYPFYRGGAPAASAWRIVSHDPRNFCHRRYIHKHSAPLGAAFASVQAEERPRTRTITDAVREMKSNEEIAMAQIVRSGIIVFMGLTVTAAGVVVIIYG